MHVFNLPPFKNKLLTDTFFNVLHDQQCKAESGIFKFCMISSIQQSSEYSKFYIISSIKQSPEYSKFCMISSISKVQNIKSFISSAA